LALVRATPLDGFLKTHDVFEPYGLDDLERERRDLRRLGF
jgi:hypothetical protein